jgi:phosphoglycolate phosphatase
MKQIKHIIWDWNGTILDDTKLCVDIINSMLTKRNKSTITEKIYSDIFDFPVKKYYQKAGFEFQKESFENLSMEYMSIYEKRKYECNLHSYFLNIQPLIKSKGIKQSILSAYAEEYLIDILSYFSILDNFIYVSGLKHILADSKIDNGIKLIEKINVPKKNCIFIGDTIHDIDAAEAMKIEYCLLPSGHNSMQRLKSRTDKIIRNFTDIYQRLSI